MYRGNEYIKSLLSILICYEIKEELQKAVHDTISWKCPVFFASIKDSLEINWKTLSCPRIRNGIPRDHLVEITTPWVLCLQKDEYLLDQQFDKIFNLISHNHHRPIEVLVERLLADEIVKPFGWITTRDLFEKPPSEIRRLFTYEPRIIPHVLLKNLGIRRINEDGQKVFFLRNSVIEASERSAIVISIKVIESGHDISKRPEDREIFNRGHQYYFEDRAYSERFAWPSSVYFTIRNYHIPSIIKGLKEGLSSIQIVYFTLIYLIRFRDFDRAMELVNLIPNYWGKRFPALLSAVGTIYFIKGQYQNALESFKESFALDPEPLVARNLIKILMITEDYAAIELFQNEYEKRTGEKLEDDFLAYFQEIHSGLPERSTTVSLCMVARDEAENIGKAIRSVQKMVDEIIVVDTGSIDQTIKTAEDLGAKVFKMKWDDDFSEARNYALSKAQGDYILVLDADEQLSPFHLLELLVLKRILSLRKQNAFKISVGYHFNESDWLFLLSELGNFREEISQVRLFPRLPEIQFTARICESVEEALVKAGIAIKTLPAASLYFLHNRQDRWRRTKRKMPAYERGFYPSGEIILSAIRDASFLGDHQKTLHWLRLFYNFPLNTMERKIRMGLQLAKFLEGTGSQEAEQVYENLLAQRPGGRSVLLAYSGFLVRHQRISEMKNLTFPSESNSEKLLLTEELDYLCYASLNAFELGDLTKAFDLLESVLGETSANLFGQAIRFYYLLKHGKLEGSISALDALLEMTSGPKHFLIDCWDDFIKVTEGLTQYFLEKGFYRERAMLLYSLVCFGKEFLR